MRQLLKVPSPFSTPFIMVSQHALNDTSSTRHPGWPSVFEKDVRKDSTFLDLDYAGLQSWDPLTSYASQASSNRHLPAQATYPSQLLGLGNERSYASDAVGPSSTVRRPRTALQGPPCAECGLSSNSRLPAVRNPTGAPLSDRLSVASRSLLSPIDLELPSDQDIPEIGNRDPGIHISSPSCNGEFPNNCCLIRATSKCQICSIDDSQVHSKAVDCTERTPRPSSLQDGNPSAPSSHVGTHSSQAENFQLETSHREMQECLVQKTRSQTIESGRLGEKPVIPIGGDPFMSGSGSRSTAIKDRFSGRAHKASSRYLPPCCGISESPIKTTEQGGCVEEAHFTTVTSPSRPQIVTISRRGSSLRPVSHVDSPQPSSPPRMDFHPITPPEGPATTPKTSRRVYEAHETEEIKRIAKVAKANHRPPITPPNSPVESRVTSSKVTYLDSVPRDSRRASYSRKRFQPVAWILDDLEFVVGNFPLTRPQLDSPVIQHIRREFMNATRSSSAVPQSTVHSLPHSRYSTRHLDSAFGSFSAHSLSHSTGGGVPHTEIFGLCPPSFGSPNSIPSFMSTPPMSTTLYALQNVFPHAPHHTLDCVQATFFALAYVSSICISHNVSLSATPVLSHSYCAATPTAQEKLGQRVYLDPPRSGTSWLRPQTPECLEAEISAQRLESLTVSLKKLFGELLTEIDDGRQLGAGDNALARAVQEMIRLCESEGDREEVGVRAEGSRRGSCGGSLGRRYGWGYPHEWFTQ